MITGNNHPEAPKPQNPTAVSGAEVGQLVKRLSRDKLGRPQAPCSTSRSPVLSQIGAKAAAARAACTAAIDHAGSDPENIDDCANLIAAARCILGQIEQIAAGSEARAVG